MSRYRQAVRGASIAGLWLTLLGAAAPFASAQDAPAPIHPAKEVFRGMPGWPATAPGEVELKSFEPFRAVYDRKYTQGSGPGKGEPRQDRVIVSAEEVAWDGRRGVAIHVLDSAAAEHADTAARSLDMIVARDDLSLLFEVGPVPGRAKDYYLARYQDGQVLLSQVNTETQKLEPKQIPVPGPGFGPGSWVIASMELAPGLRIRLAPSYSPKANPISQTDYGHVLERKTFIDASGASYAAWVVETGGWYGPTSPKALRLHVTNRPPYLLGIEIFDHDTGEASRFVWLQTVHRMAAPDAVPQPGSSSEGASPAGG